MSRPAVFLDRDGVIVEDHGYVHKVEDLALMPGAASGLRLLADAGYALVIVTNQSGIARGFFTEAQYEIFTAALLKRLAAEGIEIGAVLHCSHLPNANIPALAMDCACRKPRPGMLLRAIEQLDLDPIRSFMVGDKLSDIEAGRGAGVHSSYLIASNTEAEDSGIVPDATFNNLKACAIHIVEHHPIKAQS